MMRVLFISSGFDGGIGGHARRVSKKLAEAGMEVELMSTTHIPIKNLKNPSFALFGTIRSVLSRKKYDIVHAFNIPSAFPMKCVIAKKKVLSVHGMYSDQVSALHSRAISSVVKNFELKVLGWADVLTTDSKMVQRQYRDLGLDFEFFYAPLDVEKFRNLPDVPKRPKQIAYVGRDSYEKGIDILQTIEPKLEGSVVYCTDMKWKDAMTELKRSEMVVIPSRMESIPQVIKEAFYLGVPIVATTAGGIPELVTHNETGLLVPPEDEDRLVDAVNTVLGDKGMAEKFAQNGYTYVTSNLTWDSLLPKYIRFYRDLMK